MMKRLESLEIPDCFYPTSPTLIPPTTPTPSHSLYLSNLDDQSFHRFAIKYIYVYRKSVDIGRLKLSLGRVLVDYYPLAGRLRRACSSRDQDEDHDDRKKKKLEVDCNGEGAVFAEAFANFSVDEFVQASSKPNKSWRKLLYRVEGATSFLQTPPLVVQVTNLRDGGMILCTGISHCLCDGIGTAQFLQAWAQFARGEMDSPISPFHNRCMLKPSNQPIKSTSSHPVFVKAAPEKKCNPRSALDISKYLQSQPLAPACVTFSQSQILCLKRRCRAPSTGFEVLAAHTWRCWAKSLDLPTAKLLFSVNVRRRLKPELPPGFYGNGYVLGCAEAPATGLANADLHDLVTSIQRAKSGLTDDYVRSAVDLLEDKSVRTDLSSCLVISQWSKLGLEELDLGEGKPVWMGPLTSDIYCLFVPVIGDLNGARVLVSLPQHSVGKFEYYMTEFWT